MDQRVPFLCQHRQLNGLGPECWSKCRPAPVTIEPAVPVERAPKVRKAAAVSNAKSDAKPVSNGAARIARWRSKQDPEVRKQQNREAVQRCRAKKAGKAVAS